MNAVKLLSCDGDDERIAMEAWFTTGAQTARFDEMGHPVQEDVVDPQEVSSFLIKLLKMKHYKPFECCSMRFQVALSIPIDRQLVTYRTLVGSLALSGRYGATKDIFVVPSDLHEGLDGEYYELCEQIAGMSGAFKQRLLDAGYSSKRAREIARNLMPQGQQTCRRFSVNLRNLMHFFDERLASSAQLEVQEIAKEMFELFNQKFPAAAEAYLQACLERN